MNTLVLRVTGVDPNYTEKFLHKLFCIFIVVYMKKIVLNMTAIVLYMNDLS